MLEFDHLDLTYVENFIDMFNVIAHSYDDDEKRIALSKIERTALNYIISDFY